MDECDECGSKLINVTIEHEILYWGPKKEPFECDTPVHHCKDCGFSWIDRDGMAAMTAAQRKFEKNRCSNIS